MTQLQRHMLRHLCISPPYCWTSCELTGVLVSSCRQLVKLESWKRAERRQMRAELRQLAKEERKRQQKAVQVRRGACGCGVAARLHATWPKAFLKVLFDSLCRWAGVPAAAAARFMPCALKEAFQVLFSRSAHPHGHPVQLCRKSCKRRYWYTGVGKVVSVPLTAGCFLCARRK
jgi:hypothetical protein